MGLFCSNRSAMDPIKCESGWLCEETPDWFLDQKGLRFLNHQKKTDGDGEAVIARGCSAADRWRWSELNLRWGRKEVAEVEENTDEWRDQRMDESWPRWCWQCARGGYKWMRRGWRCSGRELYGEVIWMEMASQASTGCCCELWPTFVKWEKSDL